MTTKSLTKIDQIFCDFGGYFENVSLSKTTLGATFGITGHLFTPSSSHTIIVGIK